MALVVAEIVNLSGAINILTGLPCDTALDTQSFYTQVIRFELFVGSVQYCFNHLIFYEEVRTVLRCQNIRRLRLNIFLQSNLLIANSSFRTQFSCMR